MKKHFRWVVTASVFALVGGIGLLIARSMWEQGKRDLLVEGFKMIPGVTQHIQDFRRVQMEDGRKVWEVAAEEARLFEDDALVVVRKPLVAWYLEDGRRIGLNGDEGRVVLDGTKVQFVELKGGIQVDLVDLRIEADEAVYDHQHKRITFPGVVSVAGPALNLSGTGMLVDVEAQKLTLLADVKMTLGPDALRAGGSYDLP